MDLDLIIELAKDKYKFFEGNKPNRSREKKKEMSEEDYIDYAKTIIKLADILTNGDTIIDRVFESSKGCKYNLNSNNVIFPADK